MTDMDRCILRLRLRQKRWVNGKSGCGIRVSPSKAGPSGHEADTAFISATRMGTCSSWPRPDCGQHTNPAVPMAGMEVDRAFVRVRASSLQPCSSRSMAEKCRADECGG